MRLTRLPFAVAGLLCSIVLVGCGGSSEPKFGPPAVVSPVSGGSASIAAGVTAPIALVAKVLDASGNAVPGVAVTWSTGSGAISPASASTDASGQSTAQWTPGTVAGSQTATATVAGVASATFPLTINTGTLAKLTLAPATLLLTAVGQTSLLLLTAADAFDNPIPAASVVTTYTTDNSTVASVSGTGTVTARGNGTTTIHVIAGAGSASTVVTVNIAPGATPCTGGAMTLAVGQSQTLTGPAAGEFCVTGGAAGAEFVAIPFFGTGNGGTGSGQGTLANAFVAAPSLPITVTPISNVVASGPPTPSVGTSVRASVSANPDAALTRDVRWEARFRERVRRELSSLRTVAHNRALKTGGLRKTLNISRTAVNDAIQLNVNVDEGCANPVLVSATVKAVGSHAIVVEDNRDPASGLTPEDWQSFANAFDGQVWTVDTDNFGVPTDIDSNGHVILFFTKKVNELTPAGSTSFVGGFFYGRDLLPKTTSTGAPYCPASNFAEMFYLLAPDPNGEIAPGNNKRSTAFVKSITAGTIAHEFQHLINFGYRFYDPQVFSGPNFPEQTFLDEGLAHIAEELNYYAATGRSSRTNIDAATLVNPDDAYQAFGRQNAIRFREYLKNPDRYVPYSVLADSSLAVRGGIWSFLRYAADRKGGSEKATWLNLVRPKADVGGITNLINTFGSDILLQIRDWTIANYVDDALSVTMPAAFQHPSWNTRSVETFVNGTFPLKTINLGGTIPRSVTLADGGAAYFRFGVSAGNVGGGTVTSSATLPSTFSITVIRTK